MKYFANNLRSKTQAVKFYLAPQVPSNSSNCNIARCSFLSIRAEQRFIAERYWILLQRPANFGIFADLVGFWLILKSPIFITNFLFMKVRHNFISPFKLNFFIHLCFIAYYDIDIS